jgi:hypothetical protein
MQLVVARQARPGARVVEPQIELHSLELRDLRK